MSMESIYEYGSRAGFWRLHRMFTERNLPVTVYGVAMALQRNPDAVAAMKAAQWEIASHGLRWINYQDVDIEIEREHMRQAIEIHTKRRVNGRSVGIQDGQARTQPSWWLKGGFVYDADSYADDLPYWDTQHGKPQLSCRTPWTTTTCGLRRTRALTPVTSSSPTCVMRLMCCTRREIARLK